MWEIEIDVDGVLANMDGSYGEYVKHIIPDFSEETHILSWGMPEVKDKYPEAFEIIQSLWSNPTFFRTLPRYARVVEAIKKLGEITKGKGRIIIHTHVFDEEVAKSRYAWLEDLKEETGVDFDIEISVGSKKHTRTTSKIVIEDNVTNLHRSNAEHKILVRRGHNRNFDEKDLGDAKEAFVVKDIYDAVNIVQIIFEQKKVA